MLNVMTKQQPQEGRKNVRVRVACTSFPFDSKHLSYGDCLEFKREYYHNCFYCHCATYSMGTVNKHSSYIPVGP